MTNRAIEAFWNQYLAQAGKPMETKYIDCFYFGYNEELADSLLELVLSGRKTATSSSYPAYEVAGDRLPEAGDLSIITNWQGEPVCVIENTAVTVIPFNEMTYEICRREGEDETLESWKNNHRIAFTMGSKDEGYTFTEDMPVVFEDFRVVYVAQPA